MSKRKIITHALLHAVVAAVYIILVALFMTNVGPIVDKSESVPDAIGGSIFLLLFVTSAAIMGVVVFGRPVVWYLSGQKNESFRLIFYTIFFLVVITLVALLTIALSY